MFSLHLGGTSQQAALLVSTMQENKNLGALKFRNITEANILKFPYNLYTKTHITEAKILNNLFKKVKNKKKF